MLDSIEIQVMRQICWERAQGELNALLSTLLPESNNNNYKKMRDEVNKFVEEVENYGLCD